MSHVHAQRVDFDAPASPRRAKGSDTHGGPSDGEPFPDHTSPRHADRESIVRCDGLTKRYPKRRTWMEMLAHPLRRELVTSVDDVSFSVRRGEFFGLLGPNGAGKTTLLKLLATAVIPDEGTATVAGFDVVREARQVRRALTPLLASDRGLNWRLSARENLRLFATLYGLHGRAAAAKIEEVLAVVGLSDSGHKMLAQFSSGMLQRVAIARALLDDPRILLLDEPTRSMDPVSARDFRRFLRRELADVRGCTVLLATHSTDEALRLCDRVAILHQGRIRAIGSSKALLAEFGDDEYHVHTPEPDHPALALGERRGEYGIVRRSRDPDTGWWQIVVRMPDGQSHAAEVLARLVSAGVPIARYDRVELELADLIERVVRAPMPETRS